MENLMLTNPRASRRASSAATLGQKRWGCTTCTEQPCATCERDRARGPGKPQATRTNLSPGHTGTKHQVVLLKAKKVNPTCQQMTYFCPTGLIYTGGLVHRALSSQTFWKTMFWWEKRHVHQAMLVVGRASNGQGDRRRSPQKDNNMF